MLPSSMQSTITSGEPAAQNHLYSQNLIQRLANLGLDGKQGVEKVLLSMADEIERQSHALALKDEEITQDMEVARKIIGNNSRNYSLQLPNVDYINRAMEILSGDLILGTQTPGGGQAFMLADFTGHGLPAAIGSMIVSDTFYAMVAKGFSVVDVLLEINKKLYEMMPTGRFMSCCLLEIHPGFEGFLILNAGLPDVLVYSRDGECLHEISSSSIPLGILPSAEMKAEFCNYQIQGGERIYIYSDGLCEAENAQGLQYGIDRMKSSISSSTEKGTAVNNLVSDIDRFRTGIAQGDDIAILEVHCTDSMDEADVPGTACQSSCKSPGTWQLRYELGAKELRDTDPIPKILHFIMDIQGEGIERGVLYLILSELYSNALDHGVLGLKSSIKDEENGYLKYYELREKKLAELADAKIEIEIEHIPRGNDGLLCINIKDSGDGFDHRSSSMSLDENTLSHGRGLPLVRKKVKCLEYRGLGNEVRAEYLWSSRNS